MSTAAPEKEPQAERSMKMLPALLEKRNSIYTFWQYTVS